MGPKTHLVASQEMNTYQRESGVKLGEYDVVKFAEAFGARGYLLNNSSKIDEVMKDALKQTVPVLMHVPMDYSDNLGLYQEIDTNQGH